ncbi:phosphate starvation-inducible protein PhoH [Anaerosporomusa subterranea]|uniref:Phosphate starvation-inducible protein PhoH n=1 Tax=Anaerosporomusa subterranea TaxID=1794912 RepID=A0A154BPY5_ANASB|nr:PhoH family protein [Anaerosporomusa subterranea]KYZ76017.1 phosphate starvation-inducible protein PhoH [Anaerosporomusa subterranea]
MAKCYVLDTNVLLYSPSSIFAFSEHMVVIPEVVIEELDRFKKEATERGANSRQVSRLIDELRLQGNLLEGVDINQLGGILRLESNHMNTEMPPHWEREKADNRILQVCKGLLESGHQTILVSRDTNMRVKATILRIQAEDFRNDKVAKIDQQYTGRATVYTSSEVINQFHKDEANWLAPEKLCSYDESAGLVTAASLVTNQFLVIRSTDNDRHTALGRFDGQKVIHLRYRNRNPFGVTPRNVGQIFMQECLMLSAEEAPMVIIKGPAGTAKTFYSLAVGLYKYMEIRPREYHHLLICRPHAMLDEGIGFLPGSEAEKLEPYMRSIKDNLFTLMSGNSLVEEKEVAQAEDTVNMLFEKRIIQTEALAYQRGRSLQKYWVIFDEMQNSTPRQAKAVLTRSGLGTKIIMMGDPAQIDNPLLDSQSNGLSYAGEKMMGSKLCFQVTMLPEECERSPLAAEAAMRL